MTEPPESWYKYRGAFLQEWTQTITPLLGEAKDASRGALEFAQSAIKTAFLLNGGGLLAVPTAVAMFNIGVRDYQRDLLIVAAMFVSGLVLAYIAVVIAHFTMVEYHKSLMIAMKRATGNLNRAYYPDQETEPDEKLKNEFELSEKHYKCMRWIGTGICLVSFVAFVAGSVLGSRILTMPSLSN